MLKQRPDWTLVKNMRFNKSDFRWSQPSQGPSKSVQCRVPEKHQGSQPIDTFCRLGTYFQTWHSLWRRANPPNVSFVIPSRWKRDPNFRLETTTPLLDFRLRFPRCRKMNCSNESWKHHSNTSQIQRHSINFSLQPNRSYFSFYTWQNCLSHVKVV